MDKSTPLGLSKTTGISKKLAFSSAERELIETLVREWPIIEDKRTHVKNIELKRRAWEDLTVAYNSQPYVSQRRTIQLKRCWENIKTQRKRELSQGSISLKHTGGGPAESGSTSPDNVTETNCSYINLRVPGVIDSNTIETNTNEQYYGKNPELVYEDNSSLQDSDDMKKPNYDKIPKTKYENATANVIDHSKLEEQNDNHSRKRTMFALLENEPVANSYLPPKKKANKNIFSKPSSSKKLLSETETRVRRSVINIQQDQALHEMRIRRENILIARENNLLEFEKNLHALQLQKIKLEIELLTKQVQNKSS